MKDKIVQTDAPITFVGGGTADVGTLHAVRKHAPQVVAADSGAALALKAGVMPNAVIGDMDSLDPRVRAQIDPARIHIITEQDSTDFDKALRSVAAPLVLGVGFMGARRDHELANFNTLVRNPHRRCILVGVDELVTLAQPDLSLDLAIGSRVSLFPMRPVQGRSGGLKWPLDGLEFAPDGRVGTSNMVTGPVRLRFEAPGMLLILPRPALEPLLSAFSTQPGCWPAPV